MKKYVMIISLINLLLLGNGLNAIAVEIKASDMKTLMKYDGQTIKVKGIIERTQIAASGKVRFLNFGENYKKSLTLVIFTQDLEKFSSTIGEPTTYYNKKKIVVEGTIKLYKGMPEIIVNSPDQISFIGSENSALGIMKGDQNTRAASDKYATLIRQFGISVAEDSTDSGCYAARLQLERDFYKLKKSETNPSKSKHYNIIYTYLTVCKDDSHGGPFVGDLKCQEASKIFWETHDKITGTN